MEERTGKAGLAGALPEEFAGDMLCVCERELRVNPYGN